MVLVFFTVVPIQVVSKCNVYTIKQRREKLRLLRIFLDFRELAEDNAKCENDDVSTNDMKNEVGGARRREAMKREKM